MKLYLRQQEFIGYDYEIHGHIYKTHRETFISHWFTVFRFMQLLYLMILMILLIIYTIIVLFDRFELNANELYEEY